MQLIELRLQKILGHILPLASPPFSYVKSEKGQITSYPNTSSCFYHTQSETYCQANIAKIIKISPTL